MLQATSTRTLPKPWVAAAAVDGNQPRQLRPAPADRQIVGVEQAHAQRLRHARTAVVGAGVAAAKQDALDTHVERGADQLADAVSRRRQRVALRARHQAQPCRRRHLDHGGLWPAPAENAKVAAHRQPHRASDGQRIEASAGHLDQRFREALAAIDQRQLDDGGVGRRRAHTVRN
jgi:hypothetical protein